MKKCSIACIFGIFSFCFAFSQTNTLINDSLAKYDFKTLVQKYEQSKEPNPLLAKIYVLKLLDKAINPKEKIKALYLAGTNEIAYQVKGKKNKSLLYIEEGINISKKHNDSFLFGNLYETKGAIYYRIVKDFEAALSYYLKGLEIAKKQRDIILQLKIEHKIAALYYSIGDIDTAFAKYNTLYKKIQDTTVPNHIKIRVIKSLSNAYLKRYTVHHNQKRFIDSSTFFGLQALKLSKEEESTKDISYMYNLLGASFYFQSAYDKALYHLNISESMSQEHGISGRMPSIYHYKGKVFLAENLLDSAVYYFKKNEPILKDTSKVFMYPDTYALLVECFEKKGDYKKALAYSKLAIEYTEVVLSKKERIKSTLEKKYDLPALKEKYAELNKKLTKTTSLKNILVYLIIGLGVFFMFNFIYFKRKERRNKLHFEKIIEKLNHKEVVTESTIPKENFKHVIPEEKVAKILKDLESFEQGDLFTKPNCTLGFLAKKLNTNTSYLSQIINHYKEKSYPDYLTDLRITYVLKRLKDDRLFRAYSIKSIAEEIGYKSSKSFSKAFKNATGIYPSYYIKNLDK